MHSVCVCVCVCVVVHRAQRCGGDSGVHTIVTLGLAGSFEDSHVGLMLLCLVQMLSEIRYTRAGLSVPLSALLGRLGCRNGIARAKRCPASSIDRDAASRHRTRLRAETINRRSPSRTRTITKWCNRSNDKKFCSFQASIDPLGYNATYPSR